MYRTILLTVTICASFCLASDKKPAAKPSGDKPVVTIDSGQPGPTVLVIAPATQPSDGPALAARQMRSWSIQKGKLVTATQPDPAEAVVNRLLAQHRPDFLVVLEEDKTEGAPAVLGHSAAASESAGTLLDAVNEELRAIAGEDDADERPAPSADDPVPPTPLGLAEARRSAAVIAIADQRKLKAVAVEPSAHRQPSSNRARAYRAAVHRVLDSMEMGPSSMDQLLPRAQGTINVAVYDGAGSDRSPGPVAMSKLLTDAPGIAHTLFGPAELRESTLGQFDVLIFPGGSGSRQARGIGPDGAQAVRDFIKSGGGYVGTCAGTYLATAGYTWSLKILDANTVDRKHWRRGTGIVTLELTDDGRAMFGGETSELIPIRYANGPILEPAQRQDIPDFVTLAYFRSEVAQHGAPSGVMIDTPAIVCSTFGDGRVICFSPHPEYTKGMEAWVHKAVRWAAGE